MRGGTPRTFPQSFSGFDWAAQLEVSNATPTVYPSSEVDEPNLVAAGFAIHWSPRAWDSLLRDVADDRSPSVMLLNPETLEAYAPYDGGADLFLTNRERVATLAARWAPWLSSYPASL